MTEKIYKDLQGLSPIVMSNGNEISGIMSSGMIYYLQAYLCWNVVIVRAPVLRPDKFLPIPIIFGKDTRINIPYMDS